MPGNPTDRTPGSIITSAWGNQIRDQSVQKYANAAARAAAIPAPTEGLITVMTDTDTIEVYSGGAWVPIGWYNSTNAAAATSWTRYQPNVSSTGPNFPDLGGSGAASVGWYWKWGRTCHVNINVVGGAGANWPAPGGGILIIDRPPVPVFTNAPVDVGGFLYSAPNGTHYPVAWRTDGLVIAQGTSFVTGVTPVNWLAQGSWVAFYGSYNTSS